MYCVYVCVFVLTFCLFPSQNYVHRSGRTARADKDGLSVMMVCPEELGLYRKIVRTLNKDEELAVFPVDSNFLPSLKERLSLACKIDKLEHSDAKMKAQNQWFVRSAREMDIELDDHMLHDLGDNYERKRDNLKLTRLREELSVLLKQPLSLRGCSEKYPTISGSLVVPYHSGK